MPKRPTASPLRLALLLAALALTLGAAAPSADAAFPRRDGQVVYSWFSFSETEAGPPTTYEYAIRAVGPLGGTPTTLRGCTTVTGRPDVGDCSIRYRSPTVSPDGRRVAFATGRSLALMRIDGSSFELLPAHSAYDGEPAFSPDGKRLAYSAGGLFVAHQPAPVRGIWTSDLAGRRARRVTARGTRPSWSTRGWIAFLRADGVYRIRPDGKSSRRLVLLHRCSDVDWSPGGTKLAFTCRGRLYVTDGDGRHLRRIVVPYFGADVVAWAPSGTRLALASSEGSARTIRLDGSHERDVVGGGAGAVYNFGPGQLDWQPLPRR